MSITLDGTNGITSPGIIGVTDGSNATAGTVGEIISSFVPGNGVSVGTTGSTVNITSISLTAGDWDVSGIVFFPTSATTVVTYAFVSTSTVSATTNASDFYVNKISYASGGSATAFYTDIGLSLMPNRYNLTSTTTIYLTGKVGWSVSQAYVYGGIRARRIR